MLLEDGELALHERLFSEAESRALFDALLAGVAWSGGAIRLYGKEIPIPRLQAWYGEPGERGVYEYSGMRLVPLPWTDEMLLVRRRVEPLCGTRFTHVLVNLYRDGQDSVGWHSDDEPILGRDPVIASVSLGATRLFELRHRRRPEQRRRLELKDGSLLVMLGATQHHWKHRVPKTRRAVGPRINLTFRALR
jgi:alkylated DNA repair dioxygenase AlkB